MNEQVLVWRSSDVGGRRTDILKNNLSGIVSVTLAIRHTHGLSDLSDDRRVCSVGLESLM